MIVEDEVITQRYLKNILEQYEVEYVECYDNANDALAQLKEKTYDIILMDINIKGSMDGIQLSRDILRTYTLPIVFITAHNDTETFQEVLELSPYGFISKPFSGKDVEMAVQLANRRFFINKEKKLLEKKEEQLEEVLLTEVYLYSFVEHKLYANGNPVKLNFKQNKLLEILSQNVNSIVTYDTIVSGIWGDGFISDSALRTLVYTLRKALPDLPIVSYSKLGYALNLES